MTDTKENEKERYMIITSSPKVFPNLKFMKVSQVLRDNKEILFGYAEGRVFEVLGSKLPPRAYYSENFFGTGVTFLYLREIHPYLLPLARLVTNPGLTVDELFADLPDMLDYSYSFDLMRKYCTSEDGGEHLHPKMDEIKFWYIDLFTDMLVRKLNSEMKKEEFSGVPDSLYYLVLRFVPSCFHDDIIKMVRPNSDKEHHSEPLTEPIKNLKRQPEPVKTEAPKRRRFQNEKASKGTMNIASFFNKKP